MPETEDDPEMRHTIATALLAATALAGPARAEAIDAMGPILATAPDAATLTAQCDSYVAEIERRQHQIAQERGFKLQEHALSLYASCSKPDCEHRTRKR